MVRFPKKQGLPWLAGGLALLLCSLTLSLVDFFLGDELMLEEIQSDMQTDFEECLEYYQLPPQKRPKNKPEGCIACELTFQRRNLQSWTENTFLPPQKEIENLRYISNKEVVELANRSYFQKRTLAGDTTHILLIPLHIQYEVDNEFLTPYVFLGRYRSNFLDEDKSYLKRLQATAGGIRNQAEITLKAPSGRVILSIANMPLARLRLNRRIGVVASGFIAILLLCIALRIFTIHNSHLRYSINLGLLGFVVIVRLLLNWTGLPSQYLETDLFSPDILAFHELAPSLGELTLNIFTFAIVIWILYTHFFRTGLIVVKKVIQHQAISWILILLILFGSNYLLKWFIEVFETITLNSQVDIDFSNLFKTDLYSFLILLDAGVLLLAILLIILPLLRFNVLFVRRYQLSIEFWGFQILATLLINFYLHSTKPLLGLILSIAMCVFGFVVHRKPFAQILKFDINNYLMLLMAFTLVTTYGIVAGVNEKTKLNAEKVAERVLGSEVEKTDFSFSKSTRRIEIELKRIRDQRKILPSPNAFRDWLTENYILPNFKEFDARLFLYDPSGTRIDSRTKERPFNYGLDSDIDLRYQGDEITEDLYQIPNRENSISDSYVGIFRLHLDGDSAQPHTAILELTPASYETEGLYPSISLDKEVYENLRLVNQFDHAIYRFGILKEQKGQSAFPVYEPNYKGYKQKFKRSPADCGCYEVVVPIDHGKLIVVRYNRMEWFNVATTFSFIFYFFTTISLLIIGLPVIMFRSLRPRKIRYQIGLRSRIRFGLMAISILPMIVIIFQLYPFVQEKYREDARDDLKREATRIMNIVGPELQNLQNDRFSRVTLQRAFKDQVEGLESIVANDINVFGPDGKHLASTQPLIFENGISTDLMNAEALERLQSDALSDLVIQETLGSQEYLSIYRPVLGNSEEPVGYINIPYLAQQDQLEERVLSFLAYLANIYLLVFLVLNLVAIFVSRTITQPLSMITKRLQDTVLGEKNEQLVYETRDEIGAIVEAYNSMVHKLENSEAKLRQSQRELAWRQMARQVAHEIKNPLTPMRLSIQHMQRTFLNNPERVERVFKKMHNTLLVQIDSLVRIANSFSEFARMPEPTKTHIRVNQVLLEVVDLYSQTENVVWLIDIPKQDFWAYADRDQLSRSFNNIIKNGLQALEDNGIMQISMRVQSERCFIEIRDNGKGMPEDVQARVFEPSFSTKTSGMGLGLAIVKRIVENSNGKIYFESEVGAGTTFFIEIPSIHVVDSPNREIPEIELS
ncbi:ATP-binding protein [Pontibacter sp. G13]|uniref:sensor histidine kinase n=1 Tax=Pontibacter sp. G13 TaxID=3074898 RepID=UPI002889F623|nr:ATP-binding protein [Pontibacter sp. G13]WNJ20385.1 ATP-binding protein [Pontibacter sp. G13]